MRLQKRIGTKQRATTLLQAIFATTLSVLPAYLLGALAVQIRADLHVSPADIGGGAAILFGITGILSRPLGLLVQKQGAPRGIVGAAALAAVSLLGVGWAPSLPLLYAALAVGGVGNALAQPAANLGVSSVVGPGRLGLALGVKQTAIPAATLLAGLAVPGIALVLGWRWVLLIGAVAAAALALWAALSRAGEPRPPTADDSKTDRGTPRAGLVIITIGAGLSAAAATSLGIFVVDSAVESGITLSSAGLLFAASALLGLVVRILLGAAMDRHSGPSPYVLAANLMLGGALGFVLLALGAGPWFAAGSLIAYGSGWTWPGVIHFAVVRDNRKTAASVTGVLQTGVSLGGAAGPLGFGFLVEATSYDAAWITASGIAIAAALTFHMGRRIILRSR